MTTAVIGAGSVGRAVAMNLAAGGERVLIASRALADAQRVAEQVGQRVEARDVDGAVEASDAVVMAVWIDVTRATLTALGDALGGKIVIDPSNSIAKNADGGFARTLPDDVSAVSGLVSLLPASTRIVKAFGSISASDLAGTPRRQPDPVVLFHAGDDVVANERVAALITIAGFDPVAIGGLDQALRIEMFGDLHQGGGLGGRLLTRAEAVALV